MTPQEFAIKQTEKLQSVPEEFRGAISYLAWESGHSYGYGEVLSHLDDLIYGLREPIQKFEQRIAKESFVQGPWDIFFH